MSNFIPSEEEDVVKVTSDENTPSELTKTTEIREVEFEEEIEEKVEAKPAEEPVAEPTTEETVVKEENNTTTNIVSNPREVSYEELASSYELDMMKETIERPEGTVETQGLGISETMAARFKPRGNGMSFVDNSDSTVNYIFSKKMAELEKRGQENITAEELAHIITLQHAVTTSVPEPGANLDYHRLNTREGAKWRNGILTTNGEIIGIIGPQNSRPRAGETVISGLRAMDLIGEATGLARRRRVILPHSGFWMSFKTPTLDSYLELTKSLSQEKVNLGRSTRGAIFSAESTYIHEMLINYALNHMLDTNAPTRSHDDLKKMILVPDLISIIWALMCTHWPNGYRYQYACTATMNCDYVKEDLLNPARLYWVDNSRITDMQRRQVSRKTKEPLTVEEVEKYQLDTVLPTSRYIDLNTVDEQNKLRVKLKVPSIDEDIRIGHRWVDGIDNISIEAFMNSPLRGNDRINYINTQAYATELLKYAHWIDCFEYETEDGETVRIEETSVIEFTLKEFSAHLDMRDHILKGIRTFITDIVVAVIGFPNFECPKCKKAANTEGSISQLIAPIDAVNAFFIQCHEFLQMND